MIQHGSAHTHAGIRLKLIAAGKLIALNRVQQSEKTAAEEILPIDMLREADGNSTGDQPYEGKIMLCDAVAHGNGFFGLVGTPQHVNILCRLLRHLHHLLSAVRALLMQVQALPLHRSAAPQRAAPSYARANSPKAA